MAEFFNHNVHTVISGSAENDLIYIGVTTEEATVSSGEGNDTIEIVMNTSYNYYGGYYYGHSRTDITINDLNVSDLLHFYSPIDSFDAYIQGDSLNLVKDDYYVPGLMSIILPGVISTEQINAINNIQVNNAGTVTTLGNLISTKLSLDDYDTVYGTLGDDRFIRVYGKNSVVYGFGGNDFIDLNLRTADVTVYGGSGDDDIWGAGDGAVIYGEDGDDYIDFYWNKNATIKGGSGNDNLQVGSDAVNVSMDGESGNDYLLIDTTADNITITGGMGKDTIAFTYSDAQFFDVDPKAEVIITDLTVGEDVLRFGKSINALKAERDGQNLILTDDSDTLSITLVGITNTEMIKNVVVENDGLNGNGTLTNIGDLLINSYEALGTTGRQQLQIQSYDILNALFDSITDAIVGEIDETLDEFSQAKPLFKFIGKMIKRQTGVNADAVLDILTELNDISFALDTIIVRKAQGLEVKEELSEITGSFYRILASFNTLIDTNTSAPFALMASVFELMTNVIAGFDDGDGITPDDRRELEKSFVNIAGETAKWIATKKGISALKTPFGPIDAGVSIIIGAATAFDQYHESIAAYREDSLSTAVRDAWIDAAATGIYEGIHRYTFGLDDLLFTGMKNVAAWLTHTEPTDDDKTYMEWIGEAVKIILNGSNVIGTSGNDTLNIEDSNVIVNGDVGDDYIRIFGVNVELYGGKGSDTIFGKEGTHNNFINCGSELDYVVAYDVSSTIYGGEGNDRIIIVASEGNIEGKNDVHGDEGNDFIMLDGSDGNTVHGGKGDDIIVIQNADEQFIIYADGDGDDVIFGFDETDTLSISKGTFGTIENGNDLIVNVGSGKIILNDAVGKTLNIKQRDIIASNELSYGSDRESVTLPSSFTGMLRSLDYASTVKKIDASNVELNITIVGNNNSNTIIGGKGNDQLTGGAGDDVFVFSDVGGNDLIVDYAVGHDKIKLTSGATEGFSIDGRDVVLKIGDGSVTVKNAKGKQITVIDSAGQTSSTIYGGEDVFVDQPKNIKINKDGTSLTIKKNFVGDFDASEYSSDVKTIKATANVNPIAIVGNDIDNVIKAGKGGSTLNGGRGNDKLYGNKKGSDVFMFAAGSGDDTIYNYTPDQDKIKLTGGEVTGTSIKGSDVILYVDDNYLRIKGAKKKEITLTDAADNTLTFVGNNPWFLENIDSATNDELSAISETAYIGENLYDDSPQLTGEKFFDALLNVTYRQKYRPFSTAGAKL